MLIGRGGGAVEQAQLLLLLGPERAGPALAQPTFALGSPLVRRHDAAMPTRETLLEDFRKIRTFGKAGKRAPHKPLLLLIALARVQSGADRWLAYPEVEARLGQLLMRYSPFGNPTPWNPFWRLRNDRWRDGDSEAPLWDVRGSEALLEAARVANSGPSAKFLRDNAAAAGFPQALHAFLAANPSIVNDLAEDILERNFPATYHEELLDEIGMPWIVEWDRARPKRKRDPKFRELVLSAYNYACAFCGYDGRIGELSLGLEAAHIRWHAMGGPDDVNNGLALCSFHHKVFDYGAIALTDELVVQVKATVNWRSTSGSQLLDLHERKLQRPKHAEAPKLAHVRWHRAEVFGAQVPNS
jgi:putative restriction endonuclease